MSGHRGRSRDGRSTFWRGARFALGARSLQVAYGLISIPVGLWYFGPETYGAWLVITSVVSYLSLASLGVPNAVLTWTARYGPRHARSVLLRGLATIGVAASVLGVGLGGVALLVEPALVARLVASSDPAVGTAVLLMATATLFSLPLSTATASLAGQGRVEAQQIIQAAHLLSNLVALLLTVVLSWSLVGMALLTLVGRVGVGWAGMVWRWKQPFEPIPTSLDERVADLPSSREFILSSGRFFMLGLQGTVTLNIDQLILAHVLGPAFVPAYVAVLRLVQGIELAVTAVLASAWPAFGVLLRPGRSRSQAGALLSSTLVVAQSGMALLAIPAVVLSGWVLTLWLQEPTVAEEAQRVMVPLLAWSFIHVSFQTQATFLNAADRTGWLTILGFGDAGVNLVLSLLLAPMLGAPGVAVATLIAAVMVYPAITFLVRSELGKAETVRVTRYQLAGLVWPFTLLVPAGLLRTPLPTGALLAATASFLLALLWLGREPIIRSLRTLRTVQMH